jgi:hypothetical protein
MSIFFKFIYNEEERIPLWINTTMKVIFVVWKKHFTREITDIQK